MIKIITLKNGYHLWTCRQGSLVGKNLLCLHGGPGSNHEIFEEFGSYLNQLEINVYMYDQLGSYYSDHPDFTKKSKQMQYARLEYFVDEVEEVRKLLGLQDFYLLGHSWGGILAQEYALKYRSPSLRGLIISDMTDNISSYERSISRKRLALLGQAEVAYMERIEQQGDYADQRYQADITKLNHRFVVKDYNYGTHHVINTKNLFLYNYFQGDNEFVVKGKLKDWDISDKIDQITIPTCLIFGENDTMDLTEAGRMNLKIPQSEFHLISASGHCCMLDNPVEYFQVLGNFILDN